MFHVGYFRSIISILQTICKKCAHILLDDEEKKVFRLKLSNPNLNYMMKKAIRKKIVEKCKKLTKCPHCKEVNGFVKKLTSNKTGTGGSVLKIVHEKHRGKDKDAVIKSQMCMLDYMQTKHSYIF